MTDYPRCATCKWWGVNPDMDTVYDWDGAIPGDWRMCKRAYREWWGDKPAEGARMAAVGYESDGLATAPDFGCVQHEPKDGTE